MALPETVAKTIRVAREELPKETAVRHSKDTGNRDRARIRTAQVHLADQPDRHTREAATVDTATAVRHHLLADKTLLTTITVVQTDSAEVPDTREAVVITARL